MVDLFLFTWIQKRQCDDDTVVVAKKTTDGACFQVELKVRPRPRDSLRLAIRYLWVTFIGSPATSATTGGSQRNNRWTPRRLPLRKSDVASASNAGGRRREQQE